MLEVCRRGIFERRVGQGSSAQHVAVWCVCQCCLYLGQRQRLDRLFEMLMTAVGHLSVPRIIHAA